MPTQKTILSALAGFFLLALNWISCKKEEPAPESSYNYSYSVSLQGYKLLLYQTRDDSTNTILTANDTLTFISGNQFLYLDSLYSYSADDGHYGRHIHIPYLPVYGNGMHGTLNSNFAIGNTFILDAYRPNHTFRLWFRRIQ